MYFDVNINFGYCCNSSKNAKGGTVMKKANKTAAKVIKRVAETMANINYNAASVIGMYQPKVPKKPEFLKK